MAHDYGVNGGLQPSKADNLLLLALKVFLDGERLDWLAQKVLLILFHLSPSLGLVMPLVQVDNCGRDANGQCTVSVYRIGLHRGRFFSFLSGDCSQLYDFKNWLVHIYFWLRWSLANDRLFRLNVGDFRVDYFEFRLNPDMRIVTALYAANESRITITIVYF